MQEKRKPSKYLLVILVIFLLSLIAYAAYQLVVVTWIIPADEIQITLNDPDDDETFSVNTTYFNWTASGGSGALTHIWYADTDSTFTSQNLRSINQGTGTTMNYTAAPFLDGDWYWRVEVTDGSTTNNSATRHFVILTNASNTFPSLSSPSVSPTSGDTSDTYTYTVTFTDADNDTPTSILVYIDDVSYAMTETDATDVNTTDGKSYNYSTTLAIGTHNYSFYCADGNATNSTILYTNPVVSVATTTEGLTVKGSVGDLYSQGGNMSVFAIVKDSNGDVNTSTVTIRIYYPNGTLADSGTMNERSTGRFNYTYQMESDTVTGTYQIDINATDGSDTAYDTIATVVVKNLPFIVEDDGTIIIRRP